MLDEVPNGVPRLAHLLAGVHAAKEVAKVI